VELGLPGAALALLLGGLVIHAGLRASTPAARLGFTLLAALAVTGLSEGVLHTVPVLTVAAVSLALLVAGSSPPADPTPGLLQRFRDRVATSPLPGALLVLAAASAAVLGARQYVAERLLGRARRTADPVVVLERAERWAVHRGRIRFYLGLARAERGAPEAALALLRRSRADFPNLGTHVATGNVLMRLGRPAAAEREYRRAVFLNPRYAAAQHNLGLALRAQGQTAAAEAQLARARRLWPGRWTEPWRLRVVERLLRSAEDAPPDSALAQP
jgi:tetratricopeptide (TPR) repeat protein